MKNKFKFLSLVLGMVAMSVSFVGCDEEVGGDGPALGNEIGDGIEIGDGFGIAEGLDYPLSTQTIGEIKEDLAVKGESIVDATTDIADEPVVDVLKSFGSCGEYLDEDDMRDKMTSVKNGDVLSIKSTDLLELSDFRGKYTYYASEKEWLSERLDEDKAIFIFPAKENSSINNARIEISYSEDKVVYDDETYLVPQTAEAVVIVNEKAVAKATVAAEGLDASNLYSSITSSITLSNAANYALACKVTNTDGKHEGAVIFAKNGTPLIEGKADLLADTDLDAIVDEDVSGIGKANVSAVLERDIAVVGYADVGGIIDIEEEYDAKIDELRNKCDADEDALHLEYYGENYDGGKIYASGEYNEAMYDEYWDKYWALWDAYYLDRAKLDDAEYKEIATQATFVLVSHKDKKKLADVKLASEVVTGDYWGDSYANEYLVLVFSDGSEVDAEVYFGKGFDNVINAFEDFIKKFD
ncbi:MAG: hypothetical protein ACK5LR_02575 [Mangrovibacterium sp.]